MEATVNIHEAKTHFSKLIEQVQQGEDVIIAKAGMPVARLTLYVEPRPKIQPPGGMRGEIWMAEDFNDPLPDDMLEAIEGPL